MNGLREWIIFKDTTTNLKRRKYSILFIDDVDYRSTYYRALTCFMSAKLLFHGNTFPMKPFSIK